MHRTDYDFDVISGPSTPPPARPAVLRPPEPERARPVAAADPPRAPSDVAGAGEEV